jgi:hypothetical protein
VLVGGFKWNDTSEILNKFKLIVSFPSQNLNEAIFMQACIIIKRCLWLNDQPYNSFSEVMEQVTLMRRSVQAN